MSMFMVSRFAGCMLQARAPCATLADRRGWETLPTARADDLPVARRVRMQTGAQGACVAEARLPIASGTGPVGLGATVALA
jgi:hypothetical protein